MSFTISQPLSRKRAYSTFPLPIDKSIVPHCYRPARLHLIGLFLTIVAVDNSTPLVIVEIRLLELLTSDFYRSFTERKAPSRMDRLLEAVIIVDIREFTVYLAVSH